MAASRIADAVATVIQCTARRRAKQRARLARHRFVVRRAGIEIDLFGQTAAREPSQL